MINMWRVWREWRAAGAEENPGTAVEPVPLHRDPLLLAAALLIVLIVAQAAQIPGWVFGLVFAGYVALLAAAAFSGNREVEAMFAEDTTVSHVPQLRLVEEERNGADGGEVYDWKEAGAFNQAGGEHGGPAQKAGQRTRVPGPGPRHGA